VLFYAGEKLDFATPKALNDRERLALAEHNYGYWFDSASGFFRGCRYFIGEGLLNHAAFLLHQAAERYWPAPGWPRAPAARREPRRALARGAGRC
jgi:uncharacterized protein